MQVKLWSNRVAEKYPSVPRLVNVRYTSPFCWKRRLQHKKGKKNGFPILHHYEDIFQKCNEREIQKALREGQPYFLKTSYTLKAALRFLSQLLNFSSNQMDEIYCVLPGCAQTFPNLHPLSVDRPCLQERGALQISTNNKAERQIVRSSGWIKDCHSLKIT